MDDFSVVCQMYYQKVYRFLLSLSGNVHQAEDLTQEVFYRALLHIGRYKDDGHMYTWLCTIGKNVWLNECRKQKHTLSLENCSDNPLESPEEKIVRQDRQLALKKALLHLPEEYRDVVILHVYGSIPLKEIAAQKGKSESWGKVTFYRAKQILKQRMEEIQ